MTPLFLLLALSAGAAEIPFDARALEGIRMSASALKTQAQVRAQSPCFKLLRGVEMKAAGAPDSAFRPWNTSTSFVSRPLLPNIVAIMTPFSWSPEAKDFWLDGLELTEASLKGDLTLESTRFPLGSQPWKTLWKRRVEFKLDEPMTLRESLSQRDFRVTFLLGSEPNRGLCSPPVPRQP